ncbi:LLM class flavin-dependent oxidoreductase [Nonomuraea sp. NBC_01738]|uniref:LLM class flavin-dependent oxidoreductase n=1 Tax=Nonomuraea sp. NBC_01738 TaxID=2976003 RepID=UPI002E14F4CB|nr:LLM class flavin-dependent oxidoreductase [Nonomuraea sp. NBC_01738]
MPEAAGYQRLLRQVTPADQLGLDLVGIQDHPYQPGFLDTWALLSALAERTERVRLVPDVINLPLRQPAVLAKAAASLDILSGGRVELRLTGRLADGWLPSSSYSPPDVVAGRDPGAIRKVYNIGGRFTPMAGKGFLDGPASLWAEQLIELVHEVGMSGFVLAPGVDAERDLRVFAEEVAPAVRQRWGSPGTSRLPYGRGRCGSRWRGPAGCGRRTPGSGR